MPKDPIDGSTLPTQAAAKKISKILGCKGAHKVGDEWAPCPSRADLDYLIKHGSAKYREWVKHRRVVEKNVTFGGRAGEASKSAAAKERFASQDRAEVRASEIGCVGSHQVGQGFWSPCQSEEELNAYRGNRHRVSSTVLSARRRPRDFIRSRRRGVGVENIAGGGLVSGKS